MNIYIYNCINIVKYQTSSYIRPTRGHLLESLGVNSRLPSLTHTRTHAHTCARVNTNTHICIYDCLCLCVCVGMQGCRLHIPSVWHVCVQICTCVYIYCIQMLHMFHTHTHTHTHTHIHIHTCMYIRTFIQVHYIYIYIYVYIRIYILHICAYVLVCRNAVHKFRAGNRHVGATRSSTLVSQVLQCVAVCCSVFQVVAACCSAIQCCEKGLDR